jgi:hypothetical protein
MDHLGDRELAISDGVAGLGGDITRLLRKHVQGRRFGGFWQENADTQICEQVCANLRRR